ncbi:uncharacterized protein CLUP02_12521 [Colletotrichum lupini]|uniref:Uncharacterized protein n=1 Tax=Colletotrichum lupini TaxID=145971 RepID=A0A9Q8T0J0_9PEZI|nr:uncharacterized protein CLUP02_12521 [Colletotrichum lupini]UQC87019.1 hypothetical protein CLUP02_12521 [Colletotrichum lupini]
MAYLHIHGRETRQQKWRGVIYHVLFLNRGGFQPGERISSLHGVGFFTVSYTYPNPRFNQYRGADASLRLFVLR